MKKASLLFVMVAGMLAFQACGDNNNDTKSDMSDSTVTTHDETTSMDTAHTMNNGGTASSALSDDDNKFLMEAASGGMMEVELGQLAQQKAQNAKVKEFGSMMVTDHTKANNELKDLAQQKGATLPTMMKDEHQKHVKELSEKTGADFDKAYMDMMVDDHKEDVDKFEKCAKDAKDADLKAFATKTLPVLAKHLEVAKTTKDAVKK